MEKTDFENTVTANNNLQQTVDLREDATNTLELLAERPDIQIEQLVTGQLKLTKKVVSQTVNVPVTLNQEILVIEHALINQPANHTDEQVRIINQPAAPTQVIINGQTVTLTDAPIEIPLSQQTAKVNIDTIIAEKVQLTTKKVSQEAQIPVTLRHEELVTEQQDYEQPKVVSTTHIPPEQITFK